MCNKLCHSKGALPLTGKVTLTPPSHAYEIRTESSGRLTRTSTAREAVDVISGHLDRVDETVVTIRKVKRAS